MQNTANNNNNNITIVNNTPLTLDGIFHTAIVDHVNNGTALPTEFADLLTVTVLAGFNADGTNRGIVDEAANEFDECYNEF